MNVLIDHQIFSLQAYGGVSRYFVELANHLTLLENVKPIVLAPLNFNIHFGDLDTAVSAGRLFPGAPRKGGFFRLLNGILTKLWLRSNKPTIIHSTYYYHTRGFYPQSSRIVITVYDMIHELFPQDFPPSDNTAELKRKAVEKADHVICISQKTMDDLIRITGVSPAKISVVHLGVPKIDQDLEEDNLQLNSPYLLFVGNRNGYKNYSKLVSAFASSDELRYRYKLVCFGGGQFTAGEYDQLKRLGLSTEHVLCMNGRDSTLASLYKNATAFVYPSLYEGFGIPPLEAMAFGCPVICSDRGSIPEVVGDAGKYFNPEDANEIVDAITKVTSDHSFADDLRTKGYLRIKEFSWKRCAEETYNVYQALECR